MITLRVGKLGVGKSYSTTWEVWTKLLKGIDCYVDWEIDFTPFIYAKRNSIVWRTKKMLGMKTMPTGKLYNYQNLEELYGISDGEIYMDEAHKDLNSRDYMKIPKDFIKKMTQGRKYRTHMHFITQHEDMVDINIRRLCNVIIIYKKYGRLMYWNEYDGSYIGKFESGVSTPRSDKFRFTFFSLKFARSYDSWKIFGEAFEPFKKPPSWTMQNYHDYLDQLDAKKTERRQASRDKIKSWFVKAKPISDKDYYDLKPEINLLPARVIDTKLHDLRERVLINKHLQDVIINPRISSHEVR
jgi:hypothetical protein